LAGFLFLHCGQEPTGPNQSIIRLDLNDSLTQFDSVEIVVLLGTDTNAILQRVWNNKLVNIDEIPPISIGSLSPESVTIRIRGFYRTQGLVSETLLSQVAGRMVVVRVDLGIAPPIDTTPVIQPIRLRLSGLTSSQGTLTPTFDPSTSQYQVSLPSSSPSVTLTPIADDDRVSLSMNEIPVVAGVPPQPIQVGATNLEFVEIRLSHGDSTKIIQVLVTRYDSFGPKILSIRTVPGFPTPFNPEQSTYQWSLPYTVDSLGFFVLGGSEGAVLKVNQKVVPAGEVPSPIPLDTGANTIVITAELGGQLNAYFLNITRAPPPRPRIISFATQLPGMLPLFHPDSLAYRITVPFDSTKVQIVTLNPSDSAEVLFQDSLLELGTLPPSVLLKTGENVFTFAAQQDDITRI
jgi:hypothetical protein